MYQMLSAKASKLDLIGAFGTLTTKSIIAEAYPSIATLEQSHGREKVRNAIGVIIADLNQSFSGDLSTGEIMEIVEETRVGITCNLSLEDIYFVCRKVKTSGAFKLKVPTLLKAINDHLNEKSNEIANMNYNKHLSTKFTDNRRQSPSEIKDKLSIHELRMLSMINKNKNEK